MSDAAIPRRSFGRGTVSGDAAWSLAYSGVARLATLGVSIAVARLVGPSGTGALGVALQVTALGSMLAAFNLPQSLARHLAASESPVRRRELLQTSAWLLVGLSVVTSGVLMGLSGWLATHVYRVQALAPVLLACGPLVMATACVAWVEGALQGLGRFSRLTRWGAVLSALDLALGVLAATLGVVGVVVSRALVRATAVAGAIVRWFRSSPAEDTRSSGDFASTAAPLLGFAGPTLLSAGIVLAAQTVLRLLLVRWSTLEAAGQFQVADSIAQGLILIPGAASVAFMRSVASDQASGYAGLAGSLRRGLEQMSGYNLPLCLALMGVVPWATAALFGREFIAARPVLVLLATAYGLLGPCAVFGAALFGRGEVWFGVVLNFLWAAVVLGVYGFASAPLGAAGAALAVVAGYLVLLVVCVATLAPRWSVPVRTLAPPLLVTVASLALGCALALSPQIPTVVATIACLVLGICMMVRWALPTLAPVGHRSADD